ncbi:ribosome maturation factor RimP [Limibacter armeniacum]|uniref:ribosome maturation factor RimP n=1 Tax=Limibacter armeniacum TaxID=466084 RepID=UPI002FE61058
MELAQEVQEIVERHLPSEELFVVEVQVTGTKKLVVKVVLDGDKGVTVEQCAKVSRATGNELEERELLSDAYNLEVSSAGVGEPLLLHRQYTKNVGRKVKVFLKEGDPLEGKLENVTDEHIEVAAEIREKGKKKKVTIEPKTVAFDDIDKTEVQITF